MHQLYDKSKVPAQVGFPKDQEYYSAQPLLQENLVYNSSNKRSTPERIARLQPRRMAHCRKVLERMGYEITEVSSSLLRFTHKGSPVYLRPYSGFYVGETVITGQGFGNLVKELKRR